jgi:hypothetical protein
MTKTIFLMSGFLFFSLSTLLGQDQRRDSVLATQGMNSWYVELAGSSLIGLTVNYERFFSRKPGGLSVHAGIGGAYLFFGEGESAGFIAIPAGISYNIPISKSKRNFLELGGNYVKLAGASLINGAVSWRYLGSPKGLQIRATIIPYMYLLSDQVGFGPWFGISIGKRF